MAIGAPRSSLGASGVPGILPRARMLVVYSGFAMAVTIVAALAACRGVQPARGAAIRDDLGDSVRIASPPARIVSLDPSTTEILFALGAGRRLVGRTHWDHWPDSARLVPDLGNGLRPNIEAVLAAHPDLVLLYASAANRDAARRLRDAGITVAAFRIDRIADFRRVTRLLGRVVGDSARADQTVDTVDATLRRVRAATATLPHPTVFFEMNERPVITIGGGSYLTELVAIAGARNVYASLPAASPTVTLEDVVHRDPDYVITTPDAVAALRADAAWRPLRAVREGRVIGYDTNLVTRPSVRLGEAAISLARQLHSALRDSARIGR